MGKRVLKRPRKQRRWLAALLCVSLLAPSLAAGIAPAEAAAYTGGLCEHHPAHTADCGYVEAVEGRPCNHVHDEDCGYQAAVEEVPCDKECTDTDENGNIVHQEGCAYQPAVEEQPCTHVHDDTCGYAEAVEGAPCTYVCAICAAAEAGAEAEPAPPIPVQPAAASKSGSVTVNKIEYDLYDDGTAAATGGEPTDDVLEIPATITTQDGSEYSVTEIAEWAFEFLYPPITLKLSEGLQKIGAHAFDSAFVEGELVIPDSVTEIGEAAFTWAGVLTKIVIGDGVKSLPASVFESPSSEDPIDVVLGAGLESIDPTAFSSCDIGMVTVYSTSESLKEDISNAEGLMDASSITYIDPSAATAGELQDAIDAAVDGEEMKIVIDSNYTIGETVTIPENKIITLVDDGKPHTLTSTTDEMFRVEGHLTLASTSKDNRLTFKGGATQTTSRGNIARVINGGTLILEDAVLCGGTITAYNCGAVRVEADSTFRMSGGVIENFEMSGSTRVKGTVSVTSGGRFEMSGGVIRNNENFSSAICQGGGVLLCGWNKDQPYAVMTLSGDAVIEGNFSREGGGIYVVGNAELTMTGGTIQNNEAYSGFGGGVCVAGTGGTASEASEGKGALGTRSKFTMTGGIISENYASRSGSGVYINSDDVVLEGGYITNNEAGNHGGGVYVSEPPQLGTLYNAVVTDNTATVMGGGMWFCPTGDATLSVTNGVALYGNMAMEGGAGDDFVSLSGGTGKVTLADRMLGGGPVAWYQDGGVKGGTGGAGTPPQNVTGSVDKTVPRFDPENPGERLTSISGSGNYALKAVVSEEAITLAESQAKLWITGNQAQRGGGIGSNGAADLGEQGKDYTLQVKKEWVGGTPADGASVTVYLKIGGHRLDPVVLSAENDWTASFTDLPDPDSLTGDLAGVEYAVVEDPVPAGYEVSYSEAVVDEENRIITITVTNTKGEEPGPTTGGLTVSKTVSGGGASTTQAFTFTVTLDNRSISGSYGDMAFTDGVATFTLSHGESRTATGLPAGVGYTVVESGSGGYTVTSNGATGTIPAGKTAQAEFNNHKDSPGGGEDHETSVTVEKEWILDDGGQRPDSVTVALLRNNKVYDEVTLDEDNDWTYTWTHLDDRYNWKVQEADVPEGFTADVSHRGTIWTIINDDLPEEPETPPDEPDEPEEPDTPEEPETPPEEPDEPETDIPDDGTPGEPDQPTLPQTGQSWWPVWLLAIAGAILMLAGILVKKRYHGKHEA